MSSDPVFYIVLLLCLLAACKGGVDAELGETCRGSCAKGAVCVAGICREQGAHEICTGAHWTIPITDRLANIEPREILALRARKLTWVQVAQTLGVTLPELRSQLCRLVGLCTADVDGGFPPGEAPCVAGTDAHCRASLLCQREGLCVVANGRCVAGSEADCQESRACAERRRCKLGKLGKLGQGVAGIDKLELGSPFCASDVIGGYPLPDDHASLLQLLTVLATGPPDVALEAARYALASGVSELREAVCRGAGAAGPEAVRVALAALADHPDPYTKRACAQFTGAVP